MSEEVHVSGPVGLLEGIVEQPDGLVRGAAVVCHPHPLHAGSLRNTIVFRTARALRAAGLVTLRFNFRGVEGSEGEHDGNGGEEDGAVAGAVDDRNAGWRSGVGSEILDGKQSLSDLWQRTLDRESSPSPVSGRQERLENWVRNGIERSGRE